MGINDDPVTIKANELSVIEHAFRAGYVIPRPPEHRTGKNVAVIGSGPAGLACADNLNKAGHSVVIYEAAEAAGGYLRYGIPDFKLNKGVIDRRLDILIAEGIEIRTGVEISRDLGIDEIADSVPQHLLLFGEGEIHGAKESTRARSGSSPAFGIADLPTGSWVTSSLRCRESSTSTSMEGSPRS